MISSVSGNTRANLADELPRTKEPTISPTEHIPGDPRIFLLPKAGCLSRVWLFIHIYDMRHVYLTQTWACIITQILKKVKWFHF